jgi:glycosyltransferase involved in cell wall biosynthesis
MKHLVFTVTNDLTYDQRMDRICSTLTENGFQCTLIGRERKNSIPLESKTFEQVRLSCWFDKGKLFYLEFNFRLLMFLLRNRYDIYCAIDLDSVLPIYFNALVKRKKWVYDAHEFFTEMEEIVTRPFIRRIWVGIENFVMHRVKYAYTISNGYANLFRIRYGVNFKVIRNVPRFKPHNHAAETLDRYIIYQGALNVGRGLEESIAAMKKIEGCTLKICGDGPIKPPLMKLVEELNLKDRIEFLGALKPEDLRQQTERAWIGLTLFSDKGLHHQHSLANRFFDYLHAGIPQIAMNYPEYASFNNEFGIAILIDQLNADSVASALNSLVYDSVHYNRLRESTSFAAASNCWENESKKLVQFYQEL